MPDAVRVDARQQFRDYLARKRLRLTLQRKVIIETVFATRQHFTAEQLLAWSKKRDKSVSRATVYRTLPLLIASGMLREMDFGGDQKFYDPNYTQSPHHNHIVCQDCGRIFEFEETQAERLSRTVSQRLGFTLQTHRLQLTATCDEFRKTGACTRKD